MKNIIALSLVAIISSGCATIVRGGNQNVSVETAPIKGAECKLSNDKGSWTVAETPSTTIINRAYGDLTVICSKKGVPPQSAVFRSTMHPLMFGNILAGGIIGVAIDMSTGDAFDYPNTLTIPVKKE